MQINQLQTFANSDGGAARNPHVWTTLCWMTGRRWDCNMRMRCHCNMRRIPFGAIETASNTDSMILTALLLQQRRWDRPLGTVHFATVKCQLIQQFATIQVTKCAIPSVRWTQLFSSLWPDLLDSRRFAIIWSCSNQELMPFGWFCRVECQIRID